MERKYCANVSSRAKRTGTRSPLELRSVEFFTFLKERDVLHFRGKPLLNGLFRVEKKNKSLESGEPILRMIINAIPANALQETIEADIRTLPYFAQWSAISDDEEDKVIIWNELEHDVSFLCVPP